MIFPLLGEAATDEFYIVAEKLMSDVVLPFGKTNFNMMSARKRCSLYQEPHGVSAHHSFLKIRDEGSGWTDIR
jgi:hypothetical protein